MPSIDLERSFYERRHPRYAERLSHWEFLDATYKGGRDWFTDNIFRYHKEGDTEYGDRIKRAYRFNHTREVVELVQKYLFKAEVSRSPDVEPEIAEFWKNATLSGLTINQLMRSVATAASISGRCAVVVDNNIVVPEGSDGTMKPVSIKDAREATGRVYAYVVGARDILDYAWDEDGDGGLLWVKLREYTRNDADPFTDEGETVERIRLWTRNDWQLFEVKTKASGRGRGIKSYKTVELIDFGVHSLGAVPVVLADHVIVEDPYLVPGLIDDIAYLDRAVANYLSNLDAIIQDQSFSQLTIPAQSLLPGDDVYEKMMEMSTKRAFVYDSGSGASAKPEFISPDPKQAGVILNVVNKIINEIYHTIGLAGERTKEDNSVGIDNSSGVAKAYDFERVNSLLMTKAQACEKVENQIAALVLKWHSKDLKEAPVTYPTTFDVMRLADELVTAEALATLIAPKEVRRLQMRQLVGKLFPQMDEATTKKVEADIAKWPEDPVIAAPVKPGAPSAAAPSRQGSVTKDTPVKK